MNIWIFGQDATKNNIIFGQDATKNNIEQSKFGPNFYQIKIGSNKESYY